jgi:branched-chain amino acid transport system substrate-binding protein
MRTIKAAPTTLWVALGVALLAAVAPVRAEDGVLRVGIITDMSGQYADGNGTGSVIAAQMAAEEIGGSVAGRRIEIISADHQNKPDVAVGIVRNWIDNRGVDVVAEGVNSAVALAIQNFTRERKKLFLISGSGSSDLTGKQCSPTSVQWTYDTYASSNATAEAVVARGGTPWFFLTADYAFGQALRAVRHPFDTADFSSFLPQAQSSGARILGLANAGSDFRNAVAQADEFNIRASMQLVALQVTLTDVPALGLAHAHVRM